MAYYELNGKTFFIDDILKRSIDTKVIPQLSKKDKDYVYVVDGPERTGKSVFAMQIGGYVASVLGTPFNLSNVCMKPLEFRSKTINSVKNETVIYDEAHRGMGSRGALTEINKLLIDLMIEMGQKNLFVLIVLPSIFVLDKYPALFRARGLFHVYEHKGQRGYWCYFNRKTKLMLYQKGKKEYNYNCMRWPKFRGRFFDQYTIPEQDYRAKKACSFSENERVTKLEDVLLQRNILINIIRYKLNKSLTWLSKEFKDYNKTMPLMTLSDACNSIKLDKAYETPGQPLEKGGK